MTNWKYILIFLTAVVILIVLIIGIQKCEPTPPATTIRIDTAWVFMPREPINIDSIKATVKPRKQAVYIGVPSYITILDTLHDTIIYSSSAYSACFDTIVKKDTMGIEYDHPECVFRNFYYYPHPDSVREITKIVTIVLPQTFLQQATPYLFGIGSFFIGFGIGKVMK